MKVICSAAVCEPIVESTLSNQAIAEMAVKAASAVTDQLPDPRLPAAYELAIHGFVRVSVEFVLPEEGEAP